MFKIKIIVVLYKCFVKDSKTINSLVDIYNKNKLSLNNVEIIIYENGFLENNNFILPFEYEHLIDKENMGLATAYNYGLKSSLISNANFMGIFDQDTTLPINFFDSLFDYILIYKKNLHVAAFVPKLSYNGELFSPSRVMLGGVHRPINKDFVGIYPNEVCAVGSCTFLNVRFMNEIGGFNTLFPVDGLDRWIFYICHVNNKCVVIFPSNVNHELSILNFDKFVTEDRYKKIIEYEIKFMSLYKTNLDNLIFRLRLLIRSIRLYYFYKNKNFSKITFRYLFKFNNKLPNTNYIL